MFAKRLLPLALAQAAWAQSLTDVLASQNDTLSTLISLLEGQPELVSALAGLKDITILAPSNDAFTSLLSDPNVAAMVQSDASLVPALLSYHVINGTFYASDLTASSDPVFVPTLLTNEDYSTVSGGQRVEVLGSDKTVTIFSGGKAESKVQGADFNFTGGTIHIIDKVLSIPKNLTDVLTSTTDLSSLTGAVVKAELAQTLSDVPQLTVFAPNNAAFEAIKDTAAGLTVEQLTGVLGYHIIEGAVVYSTDVTDGASVKTLQGGELKLKVDKDTGDIFVNEAKVVLPNILVKNGVVHVIDGVLIPSSNSPSSTEPTSSATSTGSASTSTSTVVTGMAASMGAASFGVAALVGGLVAVFNL